MRDRLRAAIARLRPRRADVDADVLALSIENRRLAQHAIDDGLMIADLTREVTELREGNRRAFEGLMRLSVDKTVLEARLNARDIQLEELESELEQLRGFPSLRLAAGGV